MATVVFDANGTLFDLSPVASAIGGQERLEAFFQRTLHAAAAMTIAGTWASFDQITTSSLATTCAKLALDDVDQGAVLEALTRLPPFPDAIQAVASAGSPAILTNSSAAAAKALVESGDLAIETILSCEDVRAYKPFPAPYHFARENLGDVVLIAAHGWDVIGARAAGLRAIWLNREEQAWPFPQLDPGESAADLRNAVALATGRL